MRSAYDEAWDDRVLTLAPLPPARRGCLPHPGQGPCAQCTPPCQARDTRALPHRPVEVDTGRGIYSLGTLPGCGGAPRRAGGDESASAAASAMKAPTAPTPNHERHRYLSLPRSLQSSRSETHERRRSRRFAQRNTSQRRWLRCDQLRRLRRDSCFCVSLSASSLRPSSVARAAPMPSQRIARLTLPAARNARLADRATATSR